LIAAVSQGGGGIVIGIIGAPIGWLLYMIWAWIVLEIVIIIFRIGDDVRRMADNSGRPPGSQPIPPGPPG